MNKYQVTDVGLTNSNVSNLIAHMANGAAYNAKSLERLAFGAEPIKPATITRFFQLLRHGGMRNAKATFVYSMTATGPLFTSSAVVEELLEAEWVTKEGFDFSRCSNSWPVRVRKDDGTLATKGEQGSIEVFSKTRLFSGYNLDRTGIRADGWFNTGDRGVFAGTNLRLVGREKNTIVVHGRKTICEEIEMRLALIPRFAGIQILATAFRWPEDDTDRWPSL